MHRLRSRTGPTWICIILLVVSLAGPTSAQTPGEIVAALKEGGHVVYFRHAATTRSGVDRIEWPRAR